MVNLIIMFENGRKLSQAYTNIFKNNILVFHHFDVMLLTIHQVNRARILNIILYGLHENSKLYI